MLCAQFNLSEASCCLISDLIDNFSEFLVPIPGAACVRVQVFDEGKIEVDPSDPSCSAPDFTRSLAEFDSYNENVATYTEGQLGFKGTVIILEDASLSDTEYDVNVGGKFLQVMIKVPSCPMGPSSVPTSEPTPLPSSEPSTTPTPVPPPLTQLEVLTDLYDSTGGPSWNDDWFRFDNICDWVGYVTCDVNNFVTGLDLVGNNLVGSIPDSIGDLTTLVYLNLGRNNLVGSIPDSVFDLTILTGIYLSLNTLSGSIPDSISNAQMLMTVDLQDNILTGSIPDSMINLTNLETLLISNNDLTGTIAEELCEMVTDNTGFIESDGNDNLVGCQ